MPRALSQDVLPTSPSVPVSSSSSRPANVRYWIDSPDNGPRDFGYRFVVTFLFPKSK